jgi:pimeloyl-ACP methyl ester carboxylesterase
MPNMTPLTRVIVLCLLLALVALPVAAQDATAEAESDVITLVPHTDEAFGIEAVVPDGWTALGNGLFGRQTVPTDPVLVALQAAPLNAESLLNALLPQLALTEAPESVGIYDGLLPWTLYQVDVEAGGTTIRVDLALAESGGKTYLMLLQAPPEDYDVLHTSVFMATLDNYAPLAVDETAEELPYNVEDVTFENGDITLAGTLTTPEGEGPFAVVVLVSGSGPQDRDESLGPMIPMKPFALLADGLTRAGIAVLRYDDRGVGESGGNFATASTFDFATDAESAINYLLTRDDINPDEIGLIGHSEGGLVAAMLGARNEDLDFIISLAGPGVPGTEVLLLQNEKIILAEGGTQADVDAQIAFLNEMFAVLDDPAAIEQLTYERALAELETLSEEQRAQFGDAEQYARMVAQQSAQQYGQGWFESFLTYNPAPDWAQTTVPVLAIFGGMDVQVDAEQNAPAVEAALTEAGNEDFEIVTLPDANHLFQPTETGAISEYETLPNAFTPDLIPTIVNWLETHVTLAQ